jgi:predicted 3-demethylubiquinone-9 3-methyltransferase (glyoxalase superfamily)
MASIRPFLMFEGQAKAAIDFYISLFPDGRIDSISFYGAGEPGKEGTVNRAAFTIAGQEVMCIDSPVSHAFGFTPAMSLFIECESEEQLGALWAALIEGGSALMPVDNYGFSRKFGWLNDRFGVSWQINLQ